MTTKKATGNHCNMLYCVYSISYRALKLKKNLNQHNPCELLIEFCTFNVGQHIVLMNYVRNIVVINKQMDGKMRSSQINMWSLK